MQSYFLSPVAYVVLTAFAIAQGIGFAMVLGTGRSVALEGAVQRLFSFPFELLMFSIPVLTMRLVSEETRSGTLETLMTTPTSEAEVALGKFAGGLMFAVVLFLPLAAQLTVLATLGSLDPGPVLAGTLGLLLLTAFFTSVGLFCSAMARTQIVAGIVTLVLLLGMHSVQYLAGPESAPMAQALRYLAPVAHYISFVKGIVDTRDLAYFVFGTATFLFLTVKALELRKWR